MNIESGENTTQQTQRSFADKWVNNMHLGYQDILNEDSEITAWVLKRNGWQNFTELSNFLNSRLKILDAGCGNGRITFLFSELSKSNSITGIDINPQVAKINLQDVANIEIRHHDLLLPLDARYDFIYSEEVLHHTENPRKAFQNLVAALNRDGTIAIYVYKVKGPVREFTDEFIREKLQKLAYEESIALMEEISKFGKLLHDLDLKVKTEGITLLEIPSGEYSIQRLFYHFFFKCFWNSDLSPSENNAINFDWYSPQLATKHTTSEIRGWFMEEKLTIVHEFEDEYGITMHGVKKATS